MINLIMSHFVKNKNQFIQGTSRDKIYEELGLESNNIPYCQTDCFKHSFFLSTLRDWFNLDDNIRNSEPILLFKNRLLLFICLVQNSVFNIFDPKGLKLLTWLQLRFSHLNEHRF